MTGEQLLKIAPQGSWTFIHDGGMPGCEWDKLDWTAILTGGAQVMVRVRASASPIPSGPWTMVQANVPFAGVVGQYLQVQVTLKQGISSSAGDDCCRPTGEAAALRPHHLQEGRSAPSTSPRSSARSTAAAASAPRS